MTFYEQIWYNSQYEPRQQPFLRDFPKNHLLKIKSVDVDQTDYKVYQKLSCYIYERVLVKCANKFGAKYYFTNAECHDVDRLFKDCVELNHVLGNLKNTNPEYFATNEYSRPKPSFNELAL